MRQIYYRVKNKIAKETRLALQKRTPFVGDTTFREKGTNWYSPVMVGPSTFMEECISAQTVKSVSSIIAKLTRDKYLEFNLEYYKTGIDRFGDKWRYGDINTFLYGICNNINVANYMEIGVRRGRSMSIVAALHPQANIVGFDMWIPNYVGIENPGPDFVRSELTKVGFKGQVDFISGNSHITVPKHFKKNPDLYFDIITVDGDHTYKGALQDLKTVIPRLKVGGFLLFDDICNPEHTYLRKIWDKITAHTDRFQTFAYEELGYGVALAIKKY